MGSNGSGNQVFAVIIALVVASAALLAIGMVLRRRGSIRSPRAALLWALLTVAPLFGGGFLYMTRNVAKEVTGETKPGVNTPPNRGAP